MLEIKNLKLVLNSKTIIDDLNLKIEEAEIHTILGVNGTGKSTLAYVLMGLPEHKPQQGKIIFKGKDITNFSLSERVKTGMTLTWQEPAGFEGLTVENYLELGAKRNNADIKDCLNRVGLEPKEYLEREINENLSGGERKRIELASVLALKPDLAILDEPDSGIDLLALPTIYEAIKFLNEEGCLIVWITHNPDTGSIATRTSLICAGRIIKTGKPMEMLNFFKIHCKECGHINIIDEKLLKSEN